MLGFQIKGLTIQQVQESIDRSLRSGSHTQALGQMMGKGTGTPASRRNSPREKAALYVPTAKPSYRIDTHEGRSIRDADSA